MTIEEKVKLLNIAEKKIQSICSEYGLTIEVVDRDVYLEHHEFNDKGEINIVQKQVRFAPF